MSVAPRRPTDGMTGEARIVIFASSLGTIFEWYDFYLYGSLAATIGKVFFSSVNPTASYIFALLAFAAGFAVRPFGALFFGRIGDLVGRKYTFLITITIMGLSTFLVGLLPGYAAIGLAAPVILIALRLLQGLALGGEYGGAAVYVAEHAPHGKRGFYTSWIQTTATLGLFLSLLVILACRETIDAQSFEGWGWRIPFLLSIVLLAISVYIRLRLDESPLFQRIKAEGAISRAPLTESFAERGNLKLVLLALFGGTAGQAVVWYTGQFYTLFFLTQTLKVDPKTAILVTAAALAIATPGFVFFGWLSDRVGRKAIIMLGCLLAVVGYLPLFKAITHYANPALAAAVASAPVVVAADPAECSLQFNPVGTSKFTSSCDVAKSCAGYPRHTLFQRGGADGQRRAGQGRADRDPELRRDRGRRQNKSRGVRQVADGSIEIGGISGTGRPGRNQPWSADPAARHPGDLCDDGLRPDRGAAGRDVPDPHPLHLGVAAVSYRQWLVRRLSAGDRLCDRGGDREHL